MSSKKVIIIELTCSCKENMSHWHEEIVSEILSIVVVQLDLMPGPPMMKLN